MEKGKLILKTLITLFCSFFPTLLLLISDWKFQSHPVFQNKCVIMLFIRAYSCIPLMMFRVNYSKAFDAHAHMKTKNPVLILHSNKPALLSWLLQLKRVCGWYWVAVWCLHLNTRIHSITMQLFRQEMMKGVCSGGLCKMMIFHCYQYTCLKDFIQSALNCCVFGKIILTEACNLGNSSFSWRNQ